MEIFQHIPLSVLHNTKILDVTMHGQSQNNAITDTLQRTVLMGGKRIRPLLCFLVGEMYGLDGSTISPYARAIEMVHASSLAHDDVIDQATTRRGKPSINKISSNKKAILAGDYLLAQVIVDLSQMENIAIIQSLAQVLKDLSEGEWLQLSYIESQRVITLVETEEIAKRKTASVIEWCCGCPAELAHATPASCSAIKAFGEALGLAFQIKDDMLDFIGTSQSENSKDKFLDLKNGQINHVTTELLQLDPTLKQRLATTPDIDQLITSLGDLVQQALHKTEVRLDYHINRAHQALDSAYLEIKQTDLSNKQKRAYAALVYLSNYFHDRTN